MRLLTVVCVAALLVAFCVPAFAETQNVKVSGDMAVWAIARRGIGATGSLTKSTNGANSWDTTTIFTQQVGVNVSADLTDNVSTYIRVINERDWDQVGSASMDIDVDEAYVTIKEFLYAPLTVKLGRQNIWFGKGFIVGNNSTAWDPNGSIALNQISDSTAFDAIRGTLDYDPWTIDLVLAKIDENAVASTDDVDLYGINVGYKFDKYEAEAEAYFWANIDHNDTNATLQGHNRIYAPGIRGSFVPYENLTLYGESAWQGGTYNNSVTDENGQRSAWALDLGADYKLPNVKWTPVIGGEYIFYSGAQAEMHSKGGTDWAGWNAMYRGKFDSQIREYLDTIYATQFSGTATSLTASRINGSTNEHQAILKVVIDPIQDVKVDANINFFWLDENIDPAKNTSFATGADADTYVGTELDAKLTYDYTEDVKFQVIGGIFWPGKVYPSNQDESAGQLAARCAVEF